MLSKKHVDNYLKCLDEQRFFDAHEALEELWFPSRFTKTDEVLLLKGFINAAVSFELHKRGRQAQGKKVWGNYLKFAHLIDSKHIEQRELYLYMQNYVTKLAKRLHKL